MRRSNLIIYLAVCCCWSLAICRCCHAFSTVGSTNGVLRHSWRRSTVPLSFGIVKNPTSFAKRSSSSSSPITGRKSSSWLCMGMDMVTYLRTEWISAALCTNQTPRTANVVLQLGTEDGRAINFIPRTVRELITSSAESDGRMTLAAKRRLKEQQKLRDAGSVTYVDQPADDLRETANESVDVVISLTAADRMMENGLDWKKSVREAARVLKPGGRLLFVEPNVLKGESYLEYVQTLKEEDIPTKDPTISETDVGSAGGEVVAAQSAVVVATPERADAAIVENLVFEEVGFDEIDLVLIPHIAGVAIKSSGPPPSPQDIAAQEAQAEEDRLAELSLQAYERGLKKRKKRKVTKKGDETSASSTSAASTKATSSSKSS